MSNCGYPYATVAVRIPFPLWGPEGWMRGNGLFQGISWTVGGTPALPGHAAPGESGGVGVENRLVKHSSLP